MASEGRVGKKETIWRFMHAIGDLYMDYFQKHLSEASKCAQSHKEILQKENDAIFELYIIELMFKLENVDEQFDDPWDKACRGRTNIEAFNAMFGEIVDKLPTDELVEFMDRRKDLAWLPPNEIPPNAPKSHWWWYQGQKCNPASERVVIQFPL
ncbi:MAG: hypothetical protein LLG04_09180 [Parachlamydia sp.]|nr:hypothetical protein [Parachlamydia sp.]